MSAPEIVAALKRDSLAMYADVFARVVANSTPEHADRIARQSVGLFLEYAVSVERAAHETEEQFGGAQ